MCHMHKEALLGSSRPGSLLGSRQPRKLLKILHEIILCAFKPNVSVFILTNDF